MKIMDHDDVVEETQIRVSLMLLPSIKDEKSSLEVPSVPIAVPATLKRKGLASVLHHLLDNDDDDNNDMQFDFIIKKTNRLLRTSLENAVRSSGLNTEEAIILYYFPAINAPRDENEQEKLPDWVSALQCIGNDLLLSGSYDGTIRLHSKGNTIAEHSVSKSPVKCVEARGGTDNFMAAVGSLDHSLATYISNDGVSLERCLNCVGTHTNSVEATCFNRDGTMLLSGDFDGRVALWDTRYDNGNEAAYETDHNKRARKSDQKHDNRATIKNEISSTSTWVANTQCVSGLTWSVDEKYVITGSHDHSVKTWDAERQDCLLTLNGSRVVTCLGRCSNSDIVATGHPDCTVRLWDMRVGDAKQKEQVRVSDSSLRTSHKGWISDLQWSNENPHVLATSSYDGKICLWDIRSTIPLHSMRAHQRGEKGLCVALSNKNIFGGGTDCVIKQFSM